MTRDAVTRDPVLWLASGWRATALMLVGLQATHLLFESVRTDAVLEFRNSAEYAQFKADEVLRMMLSVPVLGMALHAALRIPAPARWQRPLRYLVMSAAAVLAAGVMSFALPWPLVAVQVGASASELVWFWYTLWMNALVAVLALEITQRLHARRRAIEQLARLREHGRLVRQQLASAQLQAIQARVDPQLLFDILGTVRRFYQHDTAAAERLLDDLTAFLRAALPRLWHARSTLEVEFGLVACLGRLLRSAGQGGFDVALDLPGQLAGTAFPAGLLLPLLSRRPQERTRDRGSDRASDRANARASDRTSGSPRDHQHDHQHDHRHDHQRDDQHHHPHEHPHNRQHDHPHHPQDRPAGRNVQLSAALAGGLLHVQLRDDAALAPAAISRLRQTLADLYGDQALATAEAAGGGTRLDLAVPLEPAADSAARWAPANANTPVSATTAGIRLESAR
jgi:hypothetical protein